MRSLLSIAVVIIALTTPACTQQKASPESYPPPGRLIDIGGRKLHWYCTGKGTPTVILIAGGGAFSIDWALVQPKVAVSTRICSYDRAGLGWSDPGPAEDTVEQTVSDLHALLHASGEHEPYVLVVASIAGIFIQAYQRVFPTDVAVLVFTNSSNRIGFQVKDKGGLIWERRKQTSAPASHCLPRPLKGPSRLARRIPLTNCRQTCRRFVCGWTCACGRSPIRPRQSPSRSCLGEKNF